MLDRSVAQVRFDGRQVLALPVIAAALWLGGVEERLHLCIRSPDQYVADGRAAASRRGSARAGTPPRALCRVRALWGPRWQAKRRLLRRSRGRLDAASNR